MGKENDSGKAAAHPRSMQETRLRRGSSDAAARRNPSRRTARTAMASRQASHNRCRTMGKETIPAKARRTAKISPFCAAIDTQGRPKSARHDRQDHGAVFGHCQASRIVHALGKEKPRRPRFHSVRITLAKASKISEFAAKRSPVTKGSVFATTPSTNPPASRTSRMPAATSQGRRSRSQNPS